jgi:RimJ/RimL family protein N-acetyltransferase
VHIEFARFTPDQTEALVDFLTGEDWPFHAIVQEAPAIRQRAAEGLYDDAESRTFWLLADGERAGLVRLRGRGLGTAALRWLTSYLFTEFPGIRRIEGNTRQDNHTMRAVFRKCGYVKESHYREAWPAPDGTVHDSAGYAILRRDWESGTVTLPDWNDEPEA